MLYKYSLLFTSIQDVKKEHISQILELREILLLFQTGFNLVNADVVCAILESVLGLEPSSVITEPRYLKLVTVSSFCPFTLISVLKPLVLVMITGVSNNTGVINGNGSGGSRLMVICLCKTSVQIYYSVPLGMRWRLIIGRLDSQS